MDNRHGNLFAQKMQRRAPPWHVAHGKVKPAGAEPGAPRLATAVPAAKLPAMTAQVIQGIQQLLATPALPELGPQPRAHGQSAAALNAQMDFLFREAKIPPPQQSLIRSLVLLWHDHLEAAHTIAQAIENPDGSFVHAIMHRREPDYWNAKYWWRRVGKHPAFPEIARRVGALLRSRGAGELAAKILPGGQWEPGAFVDACEVAATGGSPEQTEWLREVQRVETEVLLEFFCHE